MALHLIYYKSEVVAFIEIKHKVMNWPLIIVIAIFAFAFIAFLIMRNFKDEKEFVENPQHYLSKDKKNEGDIVIEKTIK